MKRYWVAQTGAPDFEELTRKGFVTFYPTVDDYVFLEATPKNQALVKQARKLDLEFLKNDDKLVTVTEKELAPMRSATVDQIMKGTQITVVRGFCEGLDGIVTKMKGNECEVLLDGLYHEYAVTVHLTDVVKREDT